jgi:hypothetical protein
VRRYYSEKRAGADVVVVEGEPGAAIVVAAWMLNRRLVQGWRSVRLTFRLRRLWIFIGY